MLRGSGSWLLDLHKFLDVSQFSPTIANLWDKESFNSHHATDTKQIKKSDVLLGYLVMFWIILYLMYEKCLNRSRIIEAVWSCGFCFGSVCYLKSPSLIKPLNLFPGERDVTHEELGALLHKSFYLHRAGMELLSHGAWVKAWTNLLLASFVVNPYREKWCTMVSTFLFYKAIDSILVNVCRFLLCLSHIIGRMVPKFFFILHCLSWTFLYTLFVPKLMLRPEDIDYTKAQLGLWLWFVAECLDSVWFRLLGCARATHWLEICLFPPPTREAIELAGIQKRHRESLKKLVNRTSKKTELWQTLFCAVAIKKKIRRIRQAKQNDRVEELEKEIEEEGVELTEL